MHEVNLMASARTRILLFLGIAAGIGLASLSKLAMAGQHSARTESRHGVAVVRRSDAGNIAPEMGPRIHLVRRANRMPRRNLRGTYCCPQAQFDIATVGGSAQGLHSQNDSGHGKIVEISPALRAVSRANNQ